LPWAQGRFDVLQRLSLRFKRNGEYDNLSPGAGSFVLRAGYATTFSANLFC
jgi:hypothetical protein